MDEIQRKLALIDNQLAGRTLRSRMVSTVPLFLPAVGLMAGIVMQDRFSSHSVGSPPSILAWLWLAATVPTAAAALVPSVRTRLRPQGLAFMASFCFLCLGALRLVAFETAGPSDIRHSVGTDRVLATVRGRLLTEPYQQVQNWCFAQFTTTDPPSVFYLQMEALETPGGWQPARGTIRVRVDEPTPNLAIGDRVQAFCWLDRFDEPTNPGQFNVAEHLRLKNVHVGASVPAREAITALDEQRSILMYLRQTFTNAAKTGLLDHPPSDTQGEAILEALLLGERRNIDPGTYEAFRRTGLLHLISLSGMHLCILIGIVWWFGKPLGLPKPLRAVVCMAATVVFLLVVPLQAPILRAAVVVWVFCIAILLRRRTNPLNSLSLAAIVLLLIQPTQLFDVGWQLSFAATAGILAFTARIDGWLREKTLVRLVSTTRDAGAAISVLRILGDWILRGLSVGLAAWLGSAGILLYHFYNITPLAGLWTLIAAAPVTAILTVGFLKIVLSSFLPTLSMLLGWLLSVLADLLIWMVRIMAQIDPFYILIGCVPAVLIVLYYGLVLFAGFFPARRPMAKRIACGVMLLTLVFSLAVLKWQRTHRNHLTITCLDVGHGQAILARLPGTKNVLFDAGSLYSGDIGSRIVVPFLDHEGIGRLHAAVVSHQDTDHFNGLPEVIDRRRVDHVYFDPASFAHSQDVQTIQVLMNHLADRRVPAERVPESIDADRARVRVLWPTEEAAAREQLSDNDKSLVCLIEYAGRKVLLCSDIEVPAQREILALYPTLKADVVIVPHHGSTRTLDSRFLEQVAAGVLVCSCGKRDYEQGRVTTPPRNGRMFVTARDGAVNVCIDGAGMVQTSFHNQQ